ncbi:MAG: hypothetical protein KDE27_11970 [Planctomycetes bacterium]|nr:hypothetical protein [Planctomycetota bacterium]
MRRSSALSLAVVALAALPLGCVGWRDLPRSNPAVAAATQHAAAVLTPEVTAAIAAYRRGLDGLARGLPAEIPATTLPRVQAALSALLMTTDEAVARLADSDRPLAIVEALSNSRKPHVRTPEGIGPRDWNKWWARAEAGLWNEHLQPILQRESQQYLERRSQLFARKYFHDPDDDGGNLIEGIVNSSFELFRSDQVGAVPDGRRSWPDSYGVSPWEAVARIEPFAAIDGEARFGALGALGVTRHLFPGQDGKETFLSEYVQRFGLRLGAGVTSRNNETGDLVLGVGLQVRSLTVWTLWDGEEDEVFVGLGSGDFRWLDELTTWFD